MAEKLLKRCEVPVEKTWRLEDIYETNEAWDADYAKLSEQVDALKTYEGKLTDRAKLLEYCNLSTDAEQRLGSLYGYARMRRDEDNANPVYQARFPLSVPSCWPRPRAILSPCARTRTSPTTICIWTT